MKQLAIALTPIAIILFYIYYKDKYDKEPKKLIFMIMFFGALACIPAIFLEVLLEGVFPEDAPTKIELFLHCLVAVALVEEGLKFIVLRIVTWKNKYFTERFDGIVYAVSVSLGFAALENILYVLGNGIGTGIIRAFTAVPMHMVFGIFMGFYYGKARFSHSSKIVKVFTCLFLPVIFHGLYDFFALAPSRGETWYLWLLVLLLIVLIIAALRLVKRESAKKTGIVEPWVE